MKKNQDAPSPELRGALREGMSRELIATGNAHETAAARRLARGLAWADLAHAVELHDAELLEPAVAARLIDGLLALPVEDFPWNPERGDAFSNREHELAARVGVGVAGWIGAGRPRREAMRVALRLTARTGVLNWWSAVEQLVGSIAEQASLHAEAECADYTYLQVAQPTTIGHWLLTFAYPGLRDIERAAKLDAEFAQSVAGVGGSAGSTWPLNRERMMQSFGTETITTHSRDAMWQTDVYVEVLAALAASAAWMSQLAQDLEIWASAEFGFVTLSDSHSRESALMPQKRNPYSLVVVRTHAARLAGDVAAALTALHTGSARTDHFQLLNDVVPSALERSAQVTQLFAAVIRDMTIDADRMRESTLDGAIMAADVADLLARTTDLDYRTAHTVVGQAARTLQDSGTSFAELEPALLQSLARDLADTAISVDPATLAAALDPATAAHSRSQTGASSPPEIASMLREIEEDLEFSRDDRAASSETFESAYALLVKRATTLRDEALSGASA